MNFDERELRKAITVLKPGGELFECRILYESKKVFSGYFRDADTLISALKRQNLSGASVYITLNRVNPACYSRSQKDTFEYGCKATTSDNDVTMYQWLFIDLDPKRPSGTSSTDEELALAKQLGNNIFLYLDNLGFAKPITALSGNGVHLLYRVDIKNTKENVDLVRNCMKALNMLFDNEFVSVDTSNFNPARIIKLYGSKANKGSDTDDRPHRMASILNVPDKVQVNEIGYLKKLADMLPHSLDEPQAYNNYNPRSFDLDEWLSRYSISYQKAAYQDGTKYILDRCPFDENHKGKDACIFRSHNGAIGFHCFHSSCQGKTWKDVRTLFEPDAYDKKREDYQARIYNHSNAKDNYQGIAKPRKEIVEKEGSPVFESALDIFNKPSEPETFIKTGIKDLDYRLRGLQNNYVTLLSGGSGSAKSTLLSNVALNAINDNKRVCVFSGELSDKNFMKWMNLQAAGKNKVVETSYANYYTVPIKTQKRIAEWMDGKFWLYNNDYGNNFKAIMKQCEKIVPEKQIDLLILDNLMAFDTNDMGYTQNDIDTNFVWALKDFARRMHIHIIFVAHPRKSNFFLRPEDISGSANLRNATDNLFIVHRIDSDFKRKSTEMFHWKWDDIDTNNPVQGATNCIEICKDRDGTNRDVFIPLWYETESKRLKNSKEENIVYGWNQDLDGYVNFALSFDDTEINTTDNPFLEEG